ncbi:MAG: fibronectin type III domain-containing protein, partial [Treponema sp.]|nr:fibronectin type III domain-containing protein [Treponema sp.]
MRTIRFLKKLSSGALAIRAALVLGAVLATTFTACEEPKAEPKPPVLIGSASVDGTPQIGQTLTANTSGLGGDGAVSYQWQRGDSANGGFTNISGATSNIYVLSAADQGKYIRVTVSRGGYSGTVNSVAVGPATAPENPALTGSTSVDGTPQIGQTLTANTSGLGGDGAVSYQWQRGDSVSSGFTNISGATSNTYVLSAADQGKYIRVTVSRDGYSGTVNSVAVGPATATDITGPDVYAIGIDFGGWPDAPSGTSGVKLTNTGNGVYTWQGTMTQDGTFKFHDASVTSWDNGNWYGPVTNNTPITVGSQVSITKAGNSNAAGAWITGETGEYSIILDISSLKTTFNRLSVSGTASITGAVQVEQTLTAHTADLSGVGTIGYQWQRSDTSSGGFTNISGATSNTYVLSTADYNKYIRVTVSRDGYSGTVSSTVMGPVASVVSAYNAVWILGPNDNWGVDQSPASMSKETDGSFTWTGIVSQDQHFRFTLEDTHNWNDDKDRGQRLQPEVDGTPITLGNEILTPFVGRNQGVPTAWRLDAPAGTYTFIVDPSNKTLAVIQTTGGPPSAPSGLTKTAAAATSISIAWNGVYGAKTYDVYVGTTSSNKTVKGSSETTNYTLTGLVAGTTYYISVTAKNDNGSSGPSTELISATKPLAPSGLTKGTVTSNSITVSWNAVSGADNYKIYVGASVADMEVKGVSTAANYSMTLSSNTEYYIVVSAVKLDEESERSNAITAKTRLAAPSGVVAEAL